MEQLEKETPLEQETRWTPIGWQLAHFGLGFVLAGGELFGAVTPFGLGLVMGSSRGYLLATTLGTLTGSALLLPHITAIRLGGAIAAAFAGRWLFREKYWVSAASGTSALLLVQLLVGVYLKSNWNDLVGTLGSGTAAVLLGYGFERLGTHTNAGACFWLCCLTVAAQQFGFGPVQPGLVLVSLCGAALCWRGSQRQTAVLTLTMAVSLSAAEKSLCYPAIFLSGAALAAQQLGENRRLPALEVFGAVGLVGAVTIGNVESAAALVIALGLGLAGGLLLPMERIDLQEVLPTAAARTAMLGAAVQVAGVAQALEMVSDTVGRISARGEAQPETFRWVIDYVAEEVCARCPDREACWSGSYSATVDGFYRLKGVLERNLRPAVEQLPEQFSGCCRQELLCRAASRGYGMYRSRKEARTRAIAMRTVLGEQYGAVAACLNGLADKLGRSAQPEPATGARLEKFFAALGLEPLSSTVQREPNGQLTASVALARMSFTQEELEGLVGEVSAICRHPMDFPQVCHCRTLTTLTFGERPALCPDFGVCSLGAEEVCGDAVRQFCDGAGNAQMLLCDGMGTGKPAAVDGSLAARLTGQLLQAGFDAQSSARLVNVALSIKSPEESGATLDLLTVNLHTGAASLYKAGAAPSFLIRKGRIKTIESTTLPIGMVDRVMGQWEQFTLQPGDYFVMISDGALADGTEWVRHQLLLSAARGQTAQQMARTLAEGARQRAGKVGRPDDITATVCYLALSNF